MSSPDNGNQPQAEEASSGPPPKYGEALLNGRKRFALNIENICEELNISKDIIEKIERSAVTDIPPVTFMQGYIRSYAKLVDVNADAVLKDFARAMPDTSASLKARSNLPKEANSNSPVIINITRLLLVCAVLAVFYGIYSYYSERLQNYDEDVAEVSAVDDVEADGSIKLEIKQDARLSEDGELILQQPAPDLMQQEMEVQQQETLEPEVTEQVVVAPEPEAVDADTIMLYADSDSWIEISGAANERLFYNLLKAGEEKKVTGSAPFSVFLGNAPDVSMMLNGKDVSFRNYVRANNTAKFRVTTEDGAVVFLKR